MKYDIPKNSRLTSRIILLDDLNRILYLNAVNPDTGEQFWIMPGGGLKKQESFEDAVLRETYEETGICAKLGPFVWVRRHQYHWNNRQLDQYERYFVGWTSNTKVNCLKPDDYVIGYRWWTLSDIKDSNNKFAPSRIRSLLPPILKGEFPKVAFDCGV